jgi:Domain of unknown function (DUF4429)/Short C-terminal domain
MATEGHNGQVNFDGTFVTITRKGFLARASIGKGEKRIPLTSITAVQIKPAGSMVNGFIQFSLPGGNEGRSKFGSQTMDASKDENTVLFTKKQQADFEQLRDEIERAIVARHAPAVPSAAAPDLADQLGKLAALRDGGILTDEEFAVQKARLLA